MSSVVAFRQNDGVCAPSAASVLRSANSAYAPASSRGYFARVSLCSGEKV